MRKYSYRFWETTAIPSDVVSFLVQIHECKGRQAAFYGQKPEILQKLVETAKMKSTAASNRIDGITTTELRIRELRNEHVIPENYEEKEILGYRIVLDAIYESYDYISIETNNILKLHRDLFKFSPHVLIDIYKEDELVDQKNNSYKGYQKRILTNYESIKNLCMAYEEIMSSRRVEPLLVDLNFVLDFLCMNPFNSGNERLSRLLTLLLLFRHGYMVGKYISIESIIEESKDSYNLSLYQSSEGWSECSNDIWPFVRYMLGVILTAYREFEKWLAIVSDSKITKDEQIRKFVDETKGLFSKSDVVNSLPNVSSTTIEKVLGEMRRQRIIKTVGSGRGTKWSKIDV